MAREDISWSLNLDHGAVSLALLEQDAGQTRSLGVGVLIEASGQIQGRLPTTEGHQITKVTSATDHGERTL